MFRERELLPQELLDHNKKHKRRTAQDKELAKQLAHAAQDEAEGVESQRLQNLAITLDKVTFATLMQSPSFPTFDNVLRSRS